MHPGTVNLPSNHVRGDDLLEGGFDLHGPSETNARKKARFGTVALQVAHHQVPMLLVGVREACEEGRHC